MSSNSKDAYKDLVRAVDNWHVEIFNYFDKGLTNAYTESINSIIRQVERMARGYSFDALRAKILFNEKFHKKRKPRFIQVLSIKLCYTIISIGVKWMIMTLQTTLVSIFPHLLRIWRRVIYKPFSTIKPNTPNVLPTGNVLQSFAFPD